LLYFLFLLWAFTKWGWICSPKFYIILICFCWWESSLFYKLFCEIVWITYFHSSFCLLSFYPTSTYILLPYKRIFPSWLKRYYIIFVWITEFEIFVFLFTVLYLFFKLGVDLFEIIILFTLFLIGCSNRFNLIFNGLVI
jgi:hypothetical protein